MSVFVGTLDLIIGKKVIWDSESLMGIWDYCVNLHVGWTKNLKPHIKKQHSYSAKDLGIRNYCTNLHVGVKYRQKAQTPDQTNNFFEPKNDVPVHIVMSVVGTLDLIRGKKGHSLAARKSSSLTQDHFAS